MTWQAISGRPWAAAAATGNPSLSAFSDAGEPLAVAARAAAYAALLASVLAPRPFRPTNLALAVGPSASSVLA
jgi:hypothetical protein